MVVDQSVHRNSVLKKKRHKTKGLVTRGNSFFTLQGSSHCKVCWKKKYIYIYIYILQVAELLIIAFENFRSQHHPE